MTNEEAIKLISERAQELAEHPQVKEAMRNLYEGGRMRLMIQQRMKMSYKAITAGA